MEPAGAYAFQQIEAALSILTDDQSPMRDRIGDAWASRLGRLTPRSFPTLETRARFATVTAICEGAPEAICSDIVQEASAMRDALVAHLGTLARPVRHEMAA